MLETITYTGLILLPYFVVIFSTALQNIYLWQVKEYRLDRVLSHFQYEGSLTLNDEFEMAMKVAFVTVCIIYYYSPFSTILGIAILLAYIYYSLKAFNIFSKYFGQRIQRPRIKSPRNILIGLGFTVVVLLPYLYFLYLIFGFNVNIVDVFNNISEKSPLISQESVVGQLRLVIESDSFKIVSLPILIALVFTSLSIVIDLAIPIIIPVLVLLTSPFSTYKKKSSLIKAQNKFGRLEDIRTIAVTGSYGKTTTKEILAQIAEKKFKVVKTEKHNNTDIGIAKTVLNKLKTDTEVFVAEMGAYKLKETADCARIARPNLVIVTGLDEQHFSLYGGINEIIDSTVEIEEFVKPGGLFVINGDDTYCLRVADKIQMRKVLYIHDDKKSEIKSNDENLYYGQLVENSDGIKFKFSFKGEVYDMQTKLRVKHDISNLIAGMICLNELGLDFEEVIKLVEPMNFELPYMNHLAGKNNSIIIDDGYNINPSGYSSGLSYLHKQKTAKNENKKLVLTQGFIELGSIRDRIYTKLAKETVNSSDGIITTDEHFANFIHDENPDFRVELLDSVFDLPATYKHIIADGDIVLLEGPMPENILKKIRESK